MYPIVAAQPGGHTRAAAVSERQGGSTLTLTYVGSSSMALSASATALP